MIYSGCEPSTTTAKNYQIHSGKFCLVVTKSTIAKTCNDQQLTCNSELSPAVPAFFDAEAASSAVKQEVWRTFASLVPLACNYIFWFWIKHVEALFLVLIFLQIFLNTLPSLWEPLFYLWVHFYFDKNKKFNFSKLFTGTTKFGIKISEHLCSAKLSVFCGVINFLIQFFLTENIMSLLE